MFADAINLDIANFQINVENFMRKMFVKTWNVKSQSVSSDILKFASFFEILDIVNSVNTVVFNTK